MSNLLETKASGQKLFGFDVPDSIPTQSSSSGLPDWARCDVVDDSMRRVQDEHIAYLQSCDRAGWARDAHRLLLRSERRGLSSRPVSNLESHHTYRYVAGILVTFLSQDSPLQFEYEDILRESYVWIHGKAVSYARRMGSRDFEDFAHDFADSYFRRLRNTNLAELNRMYLAGRLSMVGKSVANHYSSLGREEQAAKRNRKLVSYGSNAPGEENDEAPLETEDENGFFREKDAPLFEQIAGRVLCVAREYLEANPALHKLKAGILSTLRDDFRSGSDCFRNAIYRRSERGCYPENGKLPGDHYLVREVRFHEGVKDYTVRVWLDDHEAELRALADEIVRCYGL